jgi:hypothetical protein|tara:strand:+ start:61 stop:306 length:246 start_codon:yes stop_codon:yes gene_type:complete
VRVIKQFSNLNKLIQLDGTVLASKVDIQVAVLSDEIELAIARGDFFTAKVLQKRVVDVQVSTRPEKSTQGITSSQDIAPDN